MTVCPEMEENKMTMYLVEGRNHHETRGQYVLTKESAYAIAEEMQQDFLKVNIYKKDNGEYKRVEKWEREQTTEEWFCALPTKDKAEVLYNFFKARAFCEICHEYNICYVGCICKYTGEKEDFELWLKQPHTAK